MNPVTPIADINNRLEGEAIPCVVGKITKIFPRTVGIGSSSDGSVQNIELSDASGKITAVFWDRPVFGQQEYLGRVARLESTNSGKGGWAGVKVADHTYKDKTVKRLKVTLAADVSVEGVDPVATAPAAAPAAPEPAPAAAPTPDRATQTTASLTPEQLEADLKRRCVNAAKYVGRQANAFKICIARAHAMSEWNKDMWGEPFTDHQRETMVTTYYIQGARDGVWNGLPDDRDIADILTSLKPKQ